MYKLNDRIYPITKNHQFIPSIDTIFFKISFHEIGYTEIGFDGVNLTNTYLFPGMMIQGIEHEKILEQVQEASSGNRTSILEKRDLENASYGLTKTQARHSDDSTSVPLIVQEMQDASEVLYFKGQGDADASHPEISPKEFVLGVLKDGQEMILLNQLKKHRKPASVYGLHPLH